MEGSLWGHFIWGSSLLLSQECVGRALHSGVPSAALGQCVIRQVKAQRTAVLDRRLLLSRPEAQEAAVPPDPPSRPCPQQPPLSQPSLWVPPTPHVSAHRTTGQACWLLGLWVWTVPPLWPAATEPQGPRPCFPYCPLFTPSTSAVISSCCFLGAGVLLRILSLDPHLQRLRRALALPSVFLGEVVLTSSASLSLPGEGAPGTGGGTLWVQGPLAVAPMPPARSTQASLGLWPTLMERSLPSPPGHAPGLGDLQD